MIEDRSDLVRQIKARLVARGVIPSPQTTNEHAAAITWRVAWELRAEGARLILKRPGQNAAIAPNGERYSHDSIAFPGGYVDCLHSAGPPANVNGPAWDFTDSDHGPTAAPFNLDEELEPAPAPAPGPIDDPPAPAAPVVSDVAIRELTASSRILASAIDRLTDQLIALRDHGVPIRWR